MSDGAAELEFGNELANEFANEFVSGKPHPRLRPFVENYTGYAMSGAAPGIHAGLPSGSLTLIVSFGDPADVALGADADRNTYWGLVAGLHKAPALVHHQGRQNGVQLAITPRGAAALLGVPAGELALIAEHLDQVVPSYGTELIDRLTAAQSWRARWAVLDEVFLRELHLDAELPTELEHAWSLLKSSYGTASVSSVANEVGWSRRHLTKQFNQHYGLAPKTMARVLRFERAQLMLRLPTRPSLASVAAACGYADQAHMTRDWVEFAGSPPTTWMADELMALTN